VASVKNAWLLDRRSLMESAWDTTVALAYAAEELVFAAQALTSDFIAREHGLGVAHRHLHELLEHERHLPSDIARRLRNLDALYVEWEHSPATDANPPLSIVLATTTLLSHVRDRLRVPGREDRV
jgi:hypothetical protein